MVLHCLHKDKFLDEYSVAISKNAGEKFPLFDYIKKHPGIYLEIGPGSVKYEGLYEYVRSSGSILYLGDVSKDILENYCFVNNITITKSAIRPILINLKELPFIDASLSGINCSAVFHEIYTYDGAVNLEQSIKEITRCLKPGGVLTYRDPWLADGYEQLHKFEGSDLVYLYIELYKKYIDQARKGLTLSSYQKKYLDIIYNLNKEKATHVNLSLLHLYELKRHFILYICNVLGNEYLHNENDTIKLLKGLLAQNKKLSDLKDKSDNRFQREGHELYYYLDTERLLIYMLELGLNNGDDYLLIPTHETKVQFIDRPLYNEYIQSNFKARDDTGTRKMLIEGKCVIHFKKVPKSSAYRTIIQVSNALGFKKLKHYTEQNIAKFEEQPIYNHYLDY